IGGAVAADIGGERNFALLHQRFHKLWPANGKGERDLAALELVRDQRIKAVAELNDIADFQILCRFREGAPAVGGNGFVQRHLDLRAAAAAAQARRDHLGVIEDQQIARPEQVRQVRDRIIGKRLLHHEQLGALARADPPVRDALRRQGEVEKVNFHGQKCKRTAPGRPFAPKEIISILVYVSRDLEADDPVRIGDRGIPGVVALLDLVHGVHALDHLPPDGILAVEMRRPAERDKELAVAAVRMRRTRHGAGAFQMRFAGKLRRELLARPAGAGAERAAGLRHEAVNHPVKDNAVIKALARQLLDARNMARRQIGTHFDDDSAVLQFKIEGVFQVTGHRVSPLCRGRPAIADSYLGFLRFCSTRSTIFSAVAAETNLRISPSSMAISLTRLEAINWCWSDAMRKTVSISELRRRFIPTIWNSYSKSETARKPLIIMEAPTCSAKCISDAF